MFQVPEVGLFFSSLLIQLSGTSGAHWVVQGQKRQGQIYKVIKNSILNPVLLSSGSLWSVDSRSSWRLYRSMSMSILWFYLPPGAGKADKLYRDPLINAIAAADFPELQADFSKPLVEQFLSFALISRTR